MLIKLFFPRETIKRSASECALGHYVGLLDWLLRWADDSVGGYKWVKHRDYSPSPT